MRILFDAQQLSPRMTGVGYYSDRVLRALIGKETGHTWFLLCHSQNSEYVQAIAAPWPRAHVMVLSQVVPLDFRVQQEMLAKVIPEHRMDLYFSPSFLSVPRRLCPTISVVHDAAYIFYPEFHPKGVAEYLHRCVTNTCANAERVITMSEHSKRDVGRIYHFPADRIAAIALAADEEFFKNRSAAEIVPIRERYGLPGSYVLAVNMGNPKKNAAALFRAYARVSQAVRKSLKLVVVGEWSPDALDLQKLAGEAGIADEVVLTGHVPREDLYLLYAGARLFCFPSLHEGFGIPVVEAMASGVPVICSNAASLPEVAGDAAILLDPQDESAWTQAISRLVRSGKERKDLARRGLERARELAWEKTAQRTLAVISELEASRSDPLGAPASCWHPSTDHAAAGVPSLEAPASCWHPSTDHAKSVPGRCRQDGGAPSESVPEICRQDGGAPRVAAAPGALTEFLPVPLEGLLCCIAVDDVRPEPGFGGGREKDPLSYLLRLHEEFGCRASLFVPTNWKGQWPVEKRLDWLEWLLGQPAFEVASHGHLHAVSPGSPDPGEFRGVTSERLEEIIQASLQVFARVGHRPSGVKPPGWYLEPSAYGVFDRHFDYVADHVQGSAAARLSHGRLLRMPYLYTIDEMGSWPDRGLVVLQSHVAPEGATTNGWCERLYQRIRAFVRTGARLGVKFVTLAEVAVNVRQAFQPDAASLEGLTYSQQDASTSSLASPATSREGSCGETASDLDNPAAAEPARRPQGRRCGDVEPGNLADETAAIPEASDPRLHGGQVRLLGEDAGVLYNPSGDPCPFELRPDNAMIGILSRNRSGYLLDLIASIDETAPKELDRLVLLNNCEDDSAALLARKAPHWRILELHDADYPLEPPGLAWLKAHHADALPKPAEALGPRTGWVLPQSVAWLRNQVLLANERPFTLSFDDDFLVRPGWWDYYVRFQRETVSHAVFNNFGAFLLCRTLLERVGWFDERFLSSHGYEDNDYSARIAEQGIRWVLGFNKEHDWRSAEEGNPRGSMTGADYFIHRYAFRSGGYSARRDEARRDPVRAEWNERWYRLKWEDTTEDTGIFPRPPFKCKFLQRRELQEPDWYPGVIDRLGISRQLTAGRTFLKKGFSPRPLSKDFYFIRSLPPEIKFTENTPISEIDPVANPATGTLLDRYVLASHWCKGKRVLDAACGYGYGSMMLLALGASEVVGLDRDLAALNFAKARFSSPRMSFKAFDLVGGDAGQLGTFDAVVSIETMEHLFREGVERYLANLRAFLPSGGPACSAGRGAGGSAFITTPRRTSAEWHYRGGTHRYEYSREEFLGLVTQAFTGARVSFLGIDEFRVHEEPRLYSRITPQIDDRTRIMVAVVEDVP